MDTSIAATLGLGFLLGLKHALDPDHLVAVTTIVSEHKSLTRSSLVGTFWGLGHTASLVGVGMAILLLKVSIPENIAAWMEMPVALMLVALGINAIRGAAQQRGIKVHTHTHEHENEPSHTHVHLHAGASHDHRHRLLLVGRRPFLVGMVHGFAGSGAVAIAALATVPTVALGFAWIAVFGIGSIGGMLLMSAMISLPFVVTARRFSMVNNGIRLLAGLFSVAFGLMLAWDLVAEIRHAAS